MSKVYKIMIISDSNFNFVLHNWIFNLSILSQRKLNDVISLVRYASIEVHIYIYIFMYTNIVTLSILRHCVLIFKVTESKKYFKKP